jgi:hypothetical protein
MPWIARHLQLLQNVLPREFQAIPLTLGGHLLRTQRLPFVLVRSKLLLLLLDRLAFPSARHNSILGQTHLRFHVSPSPPHRLFQKDNCMHFLCIFWPLGGMLLPFRLTGSLASGFVQYR